MRASEFKEALRTGKVVVGFQQFLSSPTLTEIAGVAGFDWVFLCTEHGSLTIGSELENLIRTADGMDMTPIVRVTHNDYSIILRCLELGAKGVLVPRVRSREDVEQAVEWVKHPPLGKRGICGFTRNYRYGRTVVVPEQVNEETIVMLLIEELEAFDDLDGILSVPGVDCAVFGAGDLSMQLGIPQELPKGDVEATESLNQYRRRFAESCRRNNVPIGDILKDADSLPSLIEEGVTVFISLPDMGLIQNTLTAVVQGARKVPGQAPAGVLVP